jgi:hypothetical protein
MQRIYERNSSPDAKIRAAQQRELHLMQMQTDEIARLEQTQGDAAQGQILHMTHGFSLEALNALPYLANLHAAD